MLIESKHTQRGFTLIELLMAIAIISLLSTIFIGQLRETREKSRIANILQFDSMVNHALGSEKIVELTFNSDSYKDSAGMGTTVVQDGFAPSFFNGISGKYIWGAGLKIYNSELFDDFGDEDDYTVSFFFKSSFSGGYDNSFTQFETCNVGGPWQIMMRGSTGTVRAIVGTGVTRTVGNITTGLNDYEWHHVLLTRNYDEQRIDFYIDGVLEDTASTVGMNQDFANGCAAPPHYAHFWDVNTVKFDQVRIYAAAYER